MKRAFFLIVSAAILFSGCKPVEVVKNHYYTRTCVDSVYIDCTDSVYIVQKGDTVKITEVKERVEYRTRMTCDTAMVRDTVFIERKVPSKVGNTGKVGVFFSGFGVSAMLFFLLVTIFFIFLRKKKP